MMKGDKVLNRPIVKKNTNRKIRCSTLQTQNQKKKQPKKSNNYEQLMNIKRQLTLVEHTHTHTKMKRESEGSEPNCQKQSSQGERERESVDNPFRGEGQTPQTSANRTEHRHSNQSKHGCFAA